MDDSASEQSVCWYCGQPSDQLSLVAWPMHRRLPSEPGDAYNVVRWQTVAIAVPRCARCKRKVPVSQTLQELRREGWRAGAKPGNVESVNQIQS